MKKGVFARTVQGAGKALHPARPVCLELRAHS